MNFVDEAPVLDRERWLAERRLGIGGSDVASLFNQDWGCARRLFLEKRNVEPDYPAEYTDEMERGHELEAPAARLYASRTERTVERRPTLVSAEHPWMRVNLDREILPVPEHDGPGVLEIKTAGYKEFRRVRSEGLRNAYILQVQHAMAVTGHTWAAFAVLWPDGWKLSHFDVERDESLIRSIIVRGEAFWQTVEAGGPMPDPLPEIDKRCRSCPWRRQCRGEALLAEAREAMADDDGGIEHDEGLSPLLAEYREARRAADEADEVLEEVKTAIREHLGERTAVQCSEGKAYHRTQLSKRIDSAMLKTRYPEIWTAVQTQTPSRPLRIYTR